MKLARRPLPPLNDHYQFHCPICSILLTLPMRSAGTRGLCPACARPIVAPIPEPFQHRVADPFHPFPPTRQATRQTPGVADPVAAAPEPFTSPAPVKEFGRVAQASPPGPSEEELPYFHDPIPQGDPRAYFRNGPPKEPDLPPPDPFPEPAPPASQPPPAPVERPQPPTSPPTTRVSLDPVAGTAARSPSAGIVVNPFADPPEPPNFGPPAPAIDFPAVGGAFVQTHPAAVPPPSPAPPPAAIRTPPVENPFAPFAGFQPRERDLSPATGPSRPTADDSNRKSLGRLRGAVLVLSCILCLMIGFISGQIMALQGQAIPAPIFSRTGPTAAGDAPDPPSPDPANAEPPALPPPRQADQDPPSLTALPDPPDPNPGETPTEPDPDPESLATLKAFLSAPAWNVRAVHVLDPAAVAPELRRHGNSPIEVLSISPQLMDDGFHHYILRTKAVPEGFPVTLIRREDGWRVDWRIFDEFANDRLRAFAGGDAGRGEFHVFIKPGDPANEHYLRCDISAPPPMKDRTYPAFARLDGPAAAKIKAMLESEAVKNDPQYRLMLGNEGLPVVVALSRSSNKAGQPFLLIEELIRFGWAPGP